MSKKLQAQPYCNEPLTPMFPNRTALCPTRRKQRRVVRCKAKEPRAIQWSAGQTGTGVGTCRRDYEQDEANLEPASGLLTMNVLNPGNSPVWP